jgi:hypothetical protein
MTTEQEYSDPESPRIVSDDDESDAEKSVSNKVIFGFYSDEEDECGLRMSPSMLLTTSKKQFQSIINSK